MGFNLPFKGLIHLGFFFNLFLLFVLGILCPRRIQATY